MPRPVPAAPGEGGHRSGPCLVAIAAIVAIAGLLPAGAARAGPAPVGRLNRGPGRSVAVSPVATVPVLAARVFRAADDVALVAGGEAAPDAASPGAARAPVGRTDDDATTHAAAFRFRPGLAAGSRPATAYLRLRTAGEDARPLTVEIRAQRMADAPDPGASPPPLAPLTRAVVRWEVPPATAGGWLETPDLAPLIAEVTDLAGFGPRSRVTFLLSAPDAPGGHHRQLAQLDGDPGGAAELWIGGHAPGVLAARTPALPGPPAVATQIATETTAESARRSDPAPRRARMRSGGGRKWLEVDGEPFLVLAVQPDAWAMERPDAAAEAQFDHAAALAANTIEVPVRWAAVEPEPGAYTTAWVDWVLARARSRDLRLVLLWFGSNVVGKSSSPTGLEIVPRWVTDDPVTYSRVADAAPDPINPLDPADPDTLEREKRAFAHVLRHLAREDREGRVILWQILNEVGVLPEVEPRWSDDELTAHLVRYAGELTRLQEALHPVPAYMNFWEALRGARPFAFLDGIDELDFVGPDLYGRPFLFHVGDRDYRAFRREFLRQIERYRTARPGRNAVFVPETDTDAYYRSDLSLFYLLGRGQGIGMNVWAITTGSQRPGHDPLVDARTGELEEGGRRLRDVYAAVDPVMGPIVRTQGTARLAWTVCEEACRDTLVLRGEGPPLRLGVEADPGGALLAVREGAGELILIGREARVTGVPGAGGAPLRFGATRLVRRAP